MSELLKRLLGIRKDELVAVGWSFAYFFFVMSSYYMLRPVRDAMAVGGGVKNIPWLFTGTFVAMLIVAPIFGWIASKYPRKQFLPWVYYFFVSNILLFYALFSYADDLQLDPIWVGRSFFVWLSVFNLFVVTVFWSFMADIYSREQSRRLFGVITAGGSAGAIAGPFVTAELVVPLGFRNLLPISALLLLGAVFCIYQLRAWVRQQHHQNTDSVESNKALGGTALAGLRLTFAKPYFGGIVGMMILANFVGVAAYTYLAQLVGETFDGADLQTQVFARIDGTINILSFIGQLVLVRISVRKIGIGVTMALLPVVSVVAFAVLAIHPVFAVMAGLQIVRRSLTFGFAKPTSDMLYSVVTPEEKYKVKNFIETVVYRSSDFVAVWIIRMISGAGITGVALLCIPIAVMWTAIALWIGREYNRRDQEATAAEEQT